MEKAYQLSGMEILALMSSIEGNITGRERDGTLPEDAKALGVAPYLDDVRHSLTQAHQFPLVHKVALTYVRESFQNLCYTHLEAPDGGTDMAWLRLTISALLKLGITFTVEYRSTDGARFGSVHLAE
jgi:hypothetical protein